MEIISHYKLQGSVNGHAHGSSQSDGMRIVSDGIRGNALSLRSHRDKVKYDQSDEEMHFPCLRNLTLCPNGVTVSLWARPFDHLIRARDLFQNCASENCQGGFRIATKRTQVNSAILITKFLISSNFDGRYLA